MKKINLIISYDFFKYKDKEFEDKKHREMIFNFVKNIKRKISSIENNNNVDHEVNELFSDKDNDVLFYTGTENKIEGFNETKYVEHIKTFIIKI